MSEDFSLPILVYGIWLYKYTFFFFFGFYFDFLNKGWKGLKERLSDKNIPEPTRS